MGITSLDALAGVLSREGFTSLDTLDLYSTGTLTTGLDGESINAALIDHPADVYLFSPMTANINFAYEIADIIKSSYPESITVFGGVMATPLHREVADHPSIDYVVFDRGEYALPSLLTTIQKRGDVSKVGNLSYKIHPARSLRILSVTPTRRSATSRSRKCGGVFAALVPKPCGITVFM